MSLPTLVSLALALLLAENAVLGRGYAVRPLLAAPARLRHSLLLSAFDGVVLAAVSVGAWALNAYVLTPYNIEFLLAPAAVLAIVAFELVLELAISKLAPKLRAELGANLALSALNTAALALALILSDSATLVDAAVGGCAAALGLPLAAAVFHSLREHHRFVDAPQSFSGLPLGLVSAGLAALVFSGFVF